MSTFIGIGWRDDPPSSTSMISFKKVNTDRVHRAGKNIVHRSQFMAGRGEGKLLGKCQETLKDIPRDVPPSHTLP